MNKEKIFLLLLIAAAISMFYLSNDNLRGYLRRDNNEKDFVYQSLDSLDYYEITQRAPFKYRVLFPAVVKSTFNATHAPDDVEGYYHTYKAWSLIFFTTSVIAMFFLLRTTGFEPSYAFMGAAIFLLLPPMLMAYTLPVHTREDTLGYTLFFIGLILLLKEQRISFVIVSLLGVLTRETLLLLPLLYLFYAKDDNLIRRLFIAGLPAVLWISLRLLIGLDKYDMWEGLRWNLNNPEQVVGFLIITFNVCWIPYLLHLLYYRSSIQSSAGSRLQFFYRTSVFSLAVILITTFIGGIYNEIRLLYLFVPWIVVIFTDFVRANLELLKTSVASRTYIIYASVVVVLGAAFVYLIMLNWQRFIVPGKFRVPYELWISISCAYFVLILLFLPFSLRFLTLRKSFRQD